MVRTSIVKPEYNRRWVCSGETEMKSRNNHQKKLENECNQANVSDAVNNFKQFFALPSV